MSIENKLNKLSQTKEEIKSAIESKGQTVGDIPFAQYAEKIREIQDGVNSDENIFPPENNYMREANTISARYTVIDTESYYNELEVYSSNGTFNELYKILESGVFSQSGITKSAKKVKLINAKKTNLTFKDMYKLEEVEGLETVEILGQHTFRNCDNLYLDGNFPNVKLVNGAFSRYKNLPTNVNFPKVERVGYNIYMNQCEDVRSVTLGSPGFPVANIGLQAFQDCSFIQTIEVYVNNPSNPELPGAPWGATMAVVKYLQA